MPPDALSYKRWLDSFVIRSSQKGAGGDDGDGDGGRILQIIQVTSSTPPATT